MLKITITKDGKSKIIGELDEKVWGNEIQSKVVAMFNDESIEEISLVRTGIAEPEEEDGIVCLTCRKKPEECNCPDKNDKSFENTEK